MGGSQGQGLEAFVDWGAVVFIKKKILYFLKLVFAVWGHAMRAWHISACQGPVTLMVLDVPCDSESDQPLSREGERWLGEDGKTSEQYPARVQMLTTPSDSSRGRMSMLLFQWHLSCLRIHVLIQPPQTWGDLTERKLAGLTIGKNMCRKIESRSSSVGFRAEFTATSVHELTSLWLSFPHVYYRHSSNVGRAVAQHGEGLNRLIVKGV